MEKANENGYSIIRISQVDVKENKNNWEKHLLKSIKKYKTPTNILISPIYSSYPVYDI